MPESNIPSANSSQNQTNDIVEEQNSASSTNDSSVVISSEFSNQQINHENITVENVSLLSLSPAYRKINLITAAVFGAIVAIILFLFTSGLFFEMPENSQPFVWGAYGLIAFFTLTNALYHFVADPLKQYALREHDLNYQSGLIFKSLVSQPILRIQHIEIKRGPIERKAGLATLQVFSAGGHSYTFYIPGLEYQKAVELRQFILDHKDLASDV